MEQVKLSENAKIVVDYLVSVGDADLTVHDLSEKVDLSVAQITGIFNSLVKKGLGERIEAQVEGENETVKTVKFLKITDAGKAVDTDEAVKVQ